jgi:hypothetical protein
MLLGKADAPFSGKAEGGLGSLDIFINRKRFKA